MGCVGSSARGTTELTRSKKHRQRCLSRQLLLVAGATGCAGLIISGPVQAAWSTKDYDDVGEYSAVARAEHGTVEMHISCTWDYPGYLGMTIFTTETYDPGTSYSDEVPISVVADGVQQPVAYGAFEDLGGELAVVSDTYRNDTLEIVIGAMAKSRSTIVVQFYTREYRFSPEALDTSLPTCPRNAHDPRCPSLACASPLLIRSRCPSGPADDYVALMTALEIDKACVALKYMEFKAVRSKAQQYLESTSQYFQSADGRLAPDEYDAWRAELEEQARTAATTAGCTQQAMSYVLTAKAVAADQLYQGLLLAFHYDSLSDFDRIPLDGHKKQSAMGYEAYLRQLYGQNFDAFAQRQREAVVQMLPAADPGISGRGPRTRSSMPRRSGTSRRGPQQR